MLFQAAAHRTSAFLSLECSSVPVCPSLTSVIDGLCCGVAQQYGLPAQGKREQVMAEDTCDPSARLSCCPHTDPCAGFGGQGSGPALQLSGTVSKQSHHLLQDKKGKAVAVDQDLRSTRKALEVLLSIPSQDICRRSNTHLELALSVVESVLVSAKGYIIQRHQQLERLQVGSPTQQTCD